MSNGRLLSTIHLFPKFLSDWLLDSSDGASSQQCPRTSVSDVTLPIPVLHRLERPLSPHTPLDVMTWCPAEMCESIGPENVPVNPHNTIKNFVYCVTTTYLRIVQLGPRPAVLNFFVPRSSWPIAAVNDDFAPPLKYHIVRDAMT